MEEKKKGTWSCTIWRLKEGLCKHRGDYGPCKKIAKG